MRIFFGLTVGTDMQIPPADSVAAASLLMFFFRV